MSYDFYRILHFIFLFILFLSLGGLWFFYGLGASDGKTFKKRLSWIHGLSLFVIFVSGFGLIAKLQLPWSLWLYVKIAVWLLLGLSPLLLKKDWPFLSSKKTSLSFLFFFVLIVIAVTAARIKY